MCLYKIENSCWTVFLIQLLCFGALFMVLFFLFKIAFCRMDSVSTFRQKLTQLCIVVQKHSNYINVPLSQIFTSYSVFLILNSTIWCDVCSPLQTQLQKIQYEDGHIEQLQDERQQLLSEIRKLKEKIDTFEARWDRQ